jgi:nucleotide-binding universal stress UspA family protein
MKILVAVDGSSFTQRMLDYLASHAEWMGSAHQYTVLHVVPAVPPRAAEAMTRETLQGYYDDEAEKVFGPVRAFFASKGSAVEYTARTGHAAETIANTATEGKFDLLVLGSHGHDTLATLVLGSTTTKVLSRCGTPALLIR